VVAAEATMEQAVVLAERLRAQGIPAELDIASKSEADASRYAKRRGITTVMRVGRDGTTTEEER
jgi:histidyl-tRNA synthetase